MNFGKLPRRAARDPTSQSNGGKHLCAAFQELLEMLMDMKSHVSDTEQLLKEQEDLRDKYKVSPCEDRQYRRYLTTVEPFFI